MLHTIPKTISCHSIHNDVIHWNYISYFYFIILLLILNIDNKKTMHSLYLNLSKFSKILLALFLS